MSRLSETELSGNEAPGGSVAPVDRVGGPGADLLSRATPEGLHEGLGQVLQGQVWLGRKPRPTLSDCREGPGASLDAIWPSAAVARQLLKREARY